MSDIDSLIDNLQSIYLGQSLCILSQIILTIYAVRNVWTKHDKFPIKQLSPNSTIILMLCFPITNIISTLGRILQDHNNYYNAEILTGQCRTYHHIEMAVLAILYNFLRELPIIIFILRTFRVSLCYLRRFYKSGKPLSILMLIFRSQRNLILTGLIHTLIITSINIVLFIDSQNQSTYTHLLFEYFCPKKSTVFQYIINIYRYTLLTLAYFISIWTYSKLDFKKFLIMYFIASSSELLLRTTLVFFDLNKTTYHQIYYHSILTNMFASIILAYFSRNYEKVNQPPAAAIFQNWKAFYNDQLSLGVLHYYAENQDKDNTKPPIHNKILTYFRDLDSFQKHILLKAKNNNPIQQIPHFNQIIKIKQLEIPQARVRALTLKKQNKQFELSDLKEITAYLSNFCKNKIYEKWKKTQSYLQLRQQFQNNSHINQKFELFNITIQ